MVPVSSYARNREMELGLVELVLLIGDSWNTSLRLAGALRVEREEGWRIVSVGSILTTCGSSCSAVKAG